MKKLLLLGLFVCVAFLSFGQVEVKAYEAENEGWLVRMEEAYAESQKTGKPIMANFTGSDWCGWCRRLTASVFSKEEFKKWAKDNVILLELDYPRKKSLPDDIRSQNAQLQRAFGVRGFPTVWVFKLEKEPNKEQFNIVGLGKTGYNPSATDFIKDVDEMIARGK